MKVYEDFMRIRFSKNDAGKVFTDVGYNYHECKNMMPYSKILVQFNDDDIEQFEDDDPDVNEFVISSEFIDNDQYLLFASDENAFENLCGIFSNYNCTMYQFIIQNN